MSIKSGPRLLAAAVVVAGAVSVVAVPAIAATPASDHCSAWKQVATSKYEVKVCADLVAKKKSSSVLESVLIKNTGKQNVALSGFYGVNWNQAGTGMPFNGTKVASGKSVTINHTFSVGTGPYTALAALTVGKSSARVQTSFTK